MRCRNPSMLAVAVVAVMGFAACNSADEPAPDPAVDTPPPAAQEPTAAVDLPEGVSQEAFEEGRRLFTGQGGCHACHGPQATGTALGPDMTDDVWLNVEEPTMENIMAVIRTGVPQPVQYPAPMPPMGGARLTDDQIHALAAYVLAIN